MRLKIYQINTQRDTLELKFHDSKHQAQIKGDDKIDASIYDEVFSGEVYTSNLEEIFRQFNHQGHPLHRGHPICVSDVLVMNDMAFCCQPIGFEKVDFDESLTQKPDNLMKVVFVEPHRPPYIAEVTDGLESLQQAVGGLIEFVYNSDGTVIVCNEEGKLIGMDGNRRIGDGTSVIAGQFFVVGTVGEELRSLTEEEVMIYMDRFAEPEDISPEEVEADTGFSIFSM